MTATVKISALPTGAALGGTELIPAVQSGATVSITPAQLKTYVAPGTVTSVALTAPAEFTVSGSPVTTSGTLAFTKANQSANQVWAGPTSGAAAAPGFRALDVRDLPVGSIITLSIPVANVAATGDAGSVAVPSGLGNFAPVAQAAFSNFRNWSAGAVGSVTGTVRTASGGGGTAIFTYTGVTPPAANTIARCTTASNPSPVSNSGTVTTLYFNISATTATGTGTVDVVLQKLP